MGVYPNDTLKKCPNRVPSRILARANLLGNPIGTSQLPAVQEILNLIGGEAIGQPGVY